MSNETDPRPHAKAKRGDLVAVQHEACITYTSGKHERRTYYFLGVVESTTRAGWVKAVRTGSGALHRAPDGYYRDTMIVPSAALAIPADAVIARIESLLNGAEIRTVEELRALVAPWRVKGQVTPWPNGLGWDVDGHYVVLVGGGEMRVALRGLPEGVESPTHNVPEPGGVTEAFLRELVRARFPEAR